MRAKAELTEGVARLDRANEALAAAGFHTRNLHAPA
jgi:hypothetical protein